jgi:Ribonucleotide reductase, small chain
MEQTSPPGAKARRFDSCPQCCRYHDLWELYKKAVASFWTVEEVDLSQDMRDWERLSGWSAAPFILWLAPPSVLKAFRDTRRAVGGVFLPH